MEIKLQKAKDLPYMLICTDGAFNDLPEVGDYTVKAENVGTDTMLRTWRGWMAQIAEYMAANGATMPLWHKAGKPYGTRPFNADDAHEAFTTLLLGVDDNDKRYSWSMSKNGGNKAPKGKRLYAMEKMQAWALEKGVTLRTRENSEFMKLRQEQEK
jgi:hypothetical protein